MMMKRWVEIGFQTYSFVRSKVYVFNFKDAQIPSLISQVNEEVSGNFCIEKWGYI
jgi:hypothetical protein